MASWRLVPCSTLLLGGCLSSHTGTANFGSILLLVSVVFIDQVLLVVVVVVFFLRARALLPSDKVVL
jgi:hypothetical protein